MSEAMIAEVLRAVNNLRETVDVNHRSVTTRLDRHMDEEEDQIESFSKTLEEIKTAGERRHTALIQSINAYMEKQCDIESAFLVNKEGKRDFVGHKTDHESRLEKAETWRKRLETVTMAVMVTATVGLLGWVGSILWKAFLAGPVK